MNSLWQLLKTYQFTCCSRDEAHLFYRNNYEWILYYSTDRGELSWFVSGCVSTCLEQKKRKDKKKRVSKKGFVVKIPYFPHQNLGRLSPHKRRLHGFPRRDILRNFSQTLWLNVTTKITKIVSNADNPSPTSPRLLTVRDRSFP